MPITMTEEFKKLPDDATDREIQITQRALTFVDMLNAAEEQFGEEASCLIIALLIAIALDSSTTSKLSKHKLACTTKDTLKDYEHG